jgi:hypothetical protein
VRELLPAEPAGEDRGAGSSGEFARTGHEIGMDVRFQDRRDLETTLGGPRDVGGSVAAGIDHGEFARRFIREHVGNLGETRSEHTVDDHGHIPLRAVAN